MRELEEIVTALEKGNVDLDKSIALYERGEQLKKHCDALLKNAEARIEKIVQGADGAAKDVEKLELE
ncbi:exodeoxyribonuclease VII small subunit [Rhodoblastus acidophilus]|nr:exodeoxyribonuclease VII small subunit [Rhodoblastus acidophilus]